MKKQRYTSNEKALLGVLRERPMMSTDIADDHYRGRVRPRNAQRSVVTVLNSLILKTQRHGEAFRIRKSRRAGPNPIQYWIER